MMKEISKEMDEFLDKVDKLCWEYRFDITAATCGLLKIQGEEEDWYVGRIDGDGRGK